MERSGVTPDVAVTAPELAEVVQSEGPFATLYLTTESQVQNAAQRSEQRWKTVRREMAEAGVPEEVLGGIDPLVPDAHLHGECLAVVGNRGGVQHVEHLPRPPRRELFRWAPLPSLVPMLEWRQSSPPHVAVLADRQGADLLAFRRDRPDLHRDAGGWADPLAKSAPGGWSQRRYQERAENTWEHNADDVAREVMRLLERADARVLVAAGDVRALQLLREALPREVSENLHAVEGGRSADGSTEAFLGEVARVVDSVVDGDTAALLEKFREELGQADRAVDGSQPTLAALAQAQVEVLLVRDDPDDDRQAWFGPEPTQVAIHAEHLQGVGAGDPLQARLVDVAVRAALGTGAGVRVIPDGDLPRGGLGAILRWSG